MVLINRYKKLRPRAVFRIIFSVCFAAIALIWIAWPSDALAQVAPATSPATVSLEPTGASLFSLNCAGCHAHGGNIVRRGKNLKQKTLVRNGYGETAAIASLITQGKGAMPAYAGRLTAEEIEAIATYVLQQAQSGW